MRRAILRGLLWGLLFAIAGLSVVTGVFFYQSVTWGARFEAVRGLPEGAASILADKVFQAGYRQWARAKQTSTAQEVSETILRAWINEAARKIPSFQQASLKVGTFPGKEIGIPGKTEIRATFQLEGLDTRRLQLLIHEIEDKYPGLSCKELHLQGGKGPYAYDVPKIVFALLGLDTK